MKTPKYKAKIYVELFSVDSDSEQENEEISRGSKDTEIVNSVTSQQTFDSENISFPDNYDTETQKSDEDETESVTYMSDIQNETKITEEQQENKSPTDSEQENDSPIENKMKLDRKFSEHSNHSNEEYVKRVLMDLSSDESESENDVLKKMKKIKLDQDKDE